MPPRIGPMLLVSALALLPPAVATAQFRLPKIGKKAGDKVAARTTPPPTFNDRTLEITEQRADQLVKGLQAESRALEQADKEFKVKQAAYEEENKRYPAQRSAYDNKQKAWEDCQEREVKPVEAEQQARMDAAQRQATGGATSEEFDAKMEKVAERVKKAQAEGNMDEVMRLSDSLSRAMGTPMAAASTEASTKMQAAAGKCGREPKAPDAPMSPSKAQPNLEQIAAGATGSGGSALTPEQYAIMKERAVYAIDQKGKLRSEVGFSTAEVAALNKRGPDIASAMKSIGEHGF